MLTKLGVTVSGKVYPMQTQLSTMDPKDRTAYAHALRAYHLLTRKLGSVGLMYLLFRETTDRGYYFWRVE